MDKLINRPIDIKKKISLNINIAILNLVKDLAKLTRTNNTLVIEALLVKGVSPLIDQFKNSWVAMSIETKDNARKKRLENLLSELKKISLKKEFQPLIKGY